MKRYGYHRTSTKEQHLDRGILEITKYCSDNNLELEKIFTDQMTGKSFNRPRYLILKEDVLRPGDELIVTELDRLGRNKQEILKELQYFRDMGVRVKVLELPTTLMDLSGMDNNMAIEPDEMKALVENCRNVQAGMGSYDRVVTQAEYGQRLKMRRSIIAVKDLSAGTVLTKDMLSAKRPGDGVAPDKIGLFLGKKLKKNICSDSLIFHEDIE